MAVIKEKALLTRTKPETSTGGPRVDARGVDEAVRRRIETCSYRFVFDKVSWQYEDETLTLSGRVPSFYLKQVLQELLRGLEQIDRVANNVDVVSSSGLSSERSGKMR